MHDLKARVQPWAAGVDTQRVIDAKALGRALVGAGAALLIAAAGSTARASVPVHIAGSDGHATHPVWYHDATAVQVGNRVDVSWTTNQASVAGRAWGRVRGGWVQPGPTVFSSAVLDCGCTDSSGTNPNRHDVPTLFADPAGRVYALYGGGTASKVGGQTGPYFNAAPSADGTVPAASGETLLSVPGAAYDFEVARDRQGVNHIIGQQGDTPPGDPTGAGSLLYLRFLPGTSSAPGSFQQFGGKPYTTIVRGGYQTGACAWFVPPVAGCDIFVIGRIAAGPSNPAQPATPNVLYIEWGWSEGSLSSQCGDPAGFCNHGLYVAKSSDGGSTWCTVAGTVCTDVTATPIQYNDASYAVVSATVDVGLFKGLAVTGPYPGWLWVAWQPGADLGRGRIRAGRWTGSGWSVQTLDASRAWNNHLVLRALQDRLYLWSDIAQSGSLRGDVYRWRRDPATGGWTRATLTVGPNWFLTGHGVPGGEVLMWRAPGGAGATKVAFALLLPH